MKYKPLTVSFFIALIFSIFSTTASRAQSCNPVSFAPAANIGAGNNPISVAVADFNGDGNQDLAVVNFNSNNVSIFLGDGGGGFSAPVNLVAGSNAISVAIADFNGDGKQDLAVANFGANNVSIFLGNGDGNFQPAVNYSVAASSPYSIAVGDFNGDGRQDLAVANRDSNNVSILLGDGAGHFGVATNFGAGSQPYTIRVGDFNGDGKQDLAVANFNSNNLSILLGDGAGHFDAATNFPAGNNPISVAIGDFNGDGKQDLAVANFFSTHVSILLGDGTGSFSPPTSFGAGTNPVSIVVGDFDGDGKQDLAVANDGSNDVSILLGNGAGNFSAPINFGAALSPDRLAVGDFNGDGNLDLAITNFNSNNVSILIGDGCSTPPSPVSANVIQQWSVNTANTGYFTLEAFGDGTLLASGHNFASGNDAGVKINPHTGAILEPFPIPDLRTSIRLSTGDQDYVVGGYGDRYEVREDGSFVRYLLNFGCCNIPRYPLALDNSNDHAYAEASGELFGANMTTGDLSNHFYGAVDFVSQISIADPNTLYTAGQQGDAARLNPSSGTQWSVHIDDTYLQPGAVAADGSFVVSSGAPHFQGSTQSGRLARVRPDGTLGWNNFVNAVTPPVIGSNNLVFVGTQPAPINEGGPGAIEAYDLNTGIRVWSTPVQGLPNDLLVGDDGAVYAGTGGVSNGRVYALGQNDGAIRQTITDLPMAWELILRGGLLYASGTSITALPVQAVNYDPNSPWPVRFHDNQRTGNRQAPLLTAPREPTDQTPPQSAALLSPTPNQAGWNNSDVTVSVSSADDPGGSGVNGITYSAVGAQSIAHTSVNGSAANITITAEGITTISFFATDNAGNVESAQTLVVRIDKTPPTLSCESADGSWHAADISIACSSNDATSGLASAADATFGLWTSVAAGSETSNAATGSRQVCDIAGNCATAGPISGNKVDKKAPLIMITAPAAGNYLLTQTVTVQYTCSDGGSGVASCTGTSASGGLLNTANVGSKTFTVNATDNAGNSAVPVVVNYTVGYESLALFDQTKAAKSGSTIPIKISLVDANGANVSSAAIPVHAVSVVQVSSQSSPLLQDAGNANPDFDFRYDSGQYVFNLKTTGYGSGSYLLNFIAGGGSTVYSVGFQVRQ